MNDAAFLKAIEASPLDPTPRLVYADWLDDQGDPRGELLRIQEELRHIEVPNRTEKETRMHELLAAGIAPLTITRTNSLGMEFILIFPGELTMGTYPDDQGAEPDEVQVPVSLSQPFYLGKYPVRQPEWERIMETSPWIVDYEEAWEGSDQPATHIKWSDAVDFCKCLNNLESAESRGWSYTLPTEAQWEYACRAGTTTRFSFGDDLNLLDHFGWHLENTVEVGEEYAHPLGQKQPNPWGFHDMHGNVEEWCLDAYQQRLPGGMDPVVSEPIMGRVMRGGCWLSGKWECRSAARDYSWGIELYGSLHGFRLAWIPSENPPDSA